MTGKRLEGRSEAILDPNLPIIDTHHHLFVRPGIRYLLDEYLEDVALGHNIVASVYVDAQSMVRPDGPEMMRPLGEVEFANGMAAMSASGLFGPCRVGAAIIGSVNLLHGDRIADYLDQARSRAPERLRGFRQIAMNHPSEAIKPLMRYPAAPGVLLEARFRDGFRQLARRDLMCEVAVFHNQLGDVADLAGAFPDTAIVLNHLGMAMGYGMDAAGRGEVFSAWSRAIREVARHPNVVCKVGGLGLPFWGFGLEQRTDAIGSPELAHLWRPFVETGIEAFGADRCMMESNFPPDGTSCGFSPLWNALKIVVRNHSATEKTAMFCNNAARVYRLERPDAATSASKHS
jgi:L-fuconolactonase